MMPLFVAGVVVFHFVLLGDKCSGKTALMLRYCDDSFSQGYCKNTFPWNRKRNIEINDEIIETCVWDNNPEKISSADAIILVCDLTSADSFANLPGHIKTIKQNTNNVILVGSKSDLEKQRKVTAQQMQILANIHGYHYIECSARNDVDSVFETAILASRTCEKTKLYHLIQSISADSLFWESKARMGQIPKGAQQFTKMGSIESVIQHANYKHSANFFMLHRIFRGRDKVTNDFYRMIKQIDVNDEQSIKNAIDNLMNLRNNNSIHYNNSLN